MEGLASAGLDIRTTVSTHRAPHIWQVARAIYYRRYDVVRVLLGLVFLGAAWLKAYSLCLYGVGGVGLLSSVWVQLGIILTEWLGGLWLIAGYAPRVTRWLAVAYCASLAVVAAYHAMVGDSFCPGCFGRVFAVNGWGLLGFDVTAMLALAFCPPTAANLTKRNKHATSSVTHWILIAAIVLGIVFAAAFLAFGSFAAALAWVRGERVVVEPLVTDLGTCELGERRIIQLRVANGDDAPVRIVGGTTTCNCVATQGLPVDIPIGEDRAVPVSVIVTGESREFVQTVTLYVNGQVMRMLQARIYARLIARHEKGVEVAQ